MQQAKPYTGPQRLIAMPLSPAQEAIINAPPANVVAPAAPIRGNTWITVAIHRFYSFYNAMRLGAAAGGIDVSGLDLQTVESMAVWFEAQHD